MQVKKAHNFTNKENRYTYNTSDAGKAWTDVFPGWIGSVGPLKAHLAVAWHKEGIKAVPNQDMPSRRSKSTGGAHWLRERRDALLRLLWVNALPPQYTSVLRLLYCKGEAAGVVDGGALEWGRVSVDGSSKR